MVRYSLRDVICLLTLALISAGLVYAAELFSTAVLDYFAILDGIDSAIGWPLYTKPTLFLITLSTIEGIICGGLIALSMLSFLLLRNRWATLVAFSMPFGILCFSCLKLWMFAAPVNAEITLIFAQGSIIPALVAISLLFLGWRFRNRMPTHELGAKTSFFQRSPWQRYFVSAAFVIYFSVCGYGWYGMVSFRTEMIKTLRHLEQPEHVLYNPVWSKNSAEQRQIGVGTNRGRVLTYNLSGC